MTKKKKKKKSNNHPEGKDKSVGESTGTNEKWPFCKYLGSDFLESDVIYSTLNKSVNKEREET